MIKTLCVTVAAVLTLHGVAAAAPVTWYVNGAFEDGGTLFGSFPFNAATEVVASWNIHVAGGNTVELDLCHRSYRGILKRFRFSGSAVQLRRSSRYPEIDSINDRPTHGRGRNSEPDWRDQWIEFQR